MQNALNCPTLKFGTCPCTKASLVQIVGKSSGTDLFRNGPGKNLFDDSGLFVADQKILNRLPLFVSASGVSQAVSISNRATGIITFLVHLTKPCLDAQ